MTGAFPIHSAIVHLLLAFQLALWSPVMCCCAIKGAMGAVTGVQGTTCANDGCCAKAIAKPQMSCCESIDDESQEVPTEGKCRCHERVGDRIQLDTGGKITLPADQLLPTFLSAADTEAISPIDADLIRCNRALRAHPPPKTLLSQRSLLLI